MLALYDGLWRLFSSLSSLPLKQWQSSSLSSLPLNQWPFGRKYLRTWKLSARWTTPLSFHAWTPSQLVRVLIELCLFTSFGVSQWLHFLGQVTWHSYFLEIALWSSRSHFRSVSFLDLKDKFSVGFSDGASSGVGVDVGFISGSSLQRRIVFCWYGGASSNCRAELFALWECYSVPFGWPLTRFLLLEMHWQSSNGFRGQWSWGPLLG